MFAFLGRQDKNQGHMKLKDAESLMRLSLLAGSIEVQSALVNFVLTRQRGTTNNTSF
jgi:hypothetical protein